MTDRIDTGELERGVGARRAAAEEPIEVRRHLDVVRRKELLEHVLKEMESLRQLEAREKRYNPRAVAKSNSSSGRGWSLF